jgi:hypothetical protein
LTVGATTQLVRCVFCGSTEAVGSGAAARVQLPAHAARAEEEGLVALREAFVHAHGIDSSKWIIAAVVAIVVLPLVILRIASVLEISRLSVKSDMLLVGAALVVVTVAGYIALRQRLAPRLASRDLERFRATRGAAPERASCPNCAAPVQVPAGAAAVACCFCHAPLLASHGMLIRWVQQAEQRQREWKALARKIAARGTVRREAAGCTAVAAVLMIPAYLGLGGALVDGVRRALPFVSDDQAVGEEVVMSYSRQRGEIVAVYGKLALVELAQRVEGRPRKRVWVDVTRQPFKGKRIYPEPDPDDGNRWEVGDRVRLKEPDGARHPSTSFEVVKIYGNMVLLSDATDFWKRDDECRRAP